MIRSNLKQQVVTFWRSFLGTTLLVGAFAAIGLSTIHAPLQVQAANNQLAFSARLTTPAGNTVPDGTYAITFKLYTVASGGSAVWTETHSSSVTKGEFAEYLGSINTLSGIDFSAGTYWLSFQVETDPEMTPRYELGAVPNAFNANLLDNIDSTALFQKGLNETVTGNTTFSGTATFNAASTFTGGVAIQPAALSGNALLVNTAAGFSGNLVNLQVNGSSRLSVNQAGALTTASTLTVQSGGASITGGLTVASGGATITGDSGVTGNFNVSGTLSAVTVANSGQYTNTFSPTLPAAGWAVAVQGAPLNTANTPLVAIGSGGFTGAANNFAGTASGTLLGLNAGLAFSGNLVDYQVAGVSKFSATSAGATTQASTLTVTSGGAVISAGGITVTGNSTITGTLGGLTGLTVASGGASIAGGVTISSGDLAVSAGNITASGTINNATLSGGTLSGGTVSGGSLSATAVNGLSVSGGIITAGTWQGTVVDPQYGGTGLSSYTAGDTLYASGSSTLAKLGIGLDGTCLVAASGLPTWGSCAGSSATLQATYNNGNTITTTDARDVAITLANTATDGNFSVTVATGSTGGVAFVRADGAGTADPSALQLLDNQDTNRALPIALKIQSAAGGITTAVDVSDPDIVTGLALGASSISGTNFSVAGASGNVTAGTYNSQTVSATANFTGSVTIANTLTVSAGTVNLPAGTIDNTELANSSLTVTAGAGLANGGSVSLGSSTTLNVGAGTNITVNADDIAVVANPTFAGLVTAQAGITVSGGDLAVSAGNITASGTINNATISGGTFSGGTVSGGSLSATAVNGLSVSGGVITVGTWQGTVVDPQYGGTGLSSYTTGDTLYASGSTTLAKLGIGSTGTCLVVSGGLPSWGSCAGTTATLQATYNNGNTITTTDNRDLAITLANTATDSNFNVTVATGSTGGVAFVRADGAGTADPAQLQLLDNQDTDRLLPIALKIQSAAGGITTAVDVSDPDIVTALALGANDITGTNFSVAGASGNVTAGTYNSQTISATANFTGSLTVASGFTVSAGSVTVPAGTIDNNELANSSLTVTAGSGLINGGSVSLGSSTTLNIGAGTNITVNADDIAVVNNPTFSGLVTAQNGLTVSSGNLAVSSGNLTVSGTINNATISGGTVSGGSLSATAVNGLSVSGGVITVGTWQGDIIDPQFGGTGLDTYSQGDLLVGNGSNGLDALPIGSQDLCLVSNGTTVNWASCSSGTLSDTLQNAYDAGSTINTTNARDITITLTDQTTDSNFKVAVATGSTGGVAFVRADGAGTADPNELLLLDNLDTNRVLPTGLRIQSAAGGMTTAVDLSDAEIVTALLLGANDVSGTNFTVTGSTGAVTSGTINGQTITSNASFTGALTVANNFTVSAGSVALPAGTIDNNELANSSLTVTAGSGLTNGGSVSLGGSTTINIGAGTNITVNADDVAVVANPTFSGLVTASAALSVTGGIDNNAGGITETGAISGATTVDADNQVTLSRTGANALRVTGAPAASATSSLVQLGSAIAGGSASGTFLGVNAANGYGGNLVDLQVNGTKRFVLDANGVITSSTWQGSTVGVQYGGTGLSSYSTGDLIYASAATTLSKLAVGSDGTCLVLASGLPTWSGCAGTSATLQSTYNNGNTITTTDNRDLAITLANTATDSNFTVAVATDSTSQVAFVRNDGAGTADPSALVRIDNLDTNRVLPVGMAVQAAAGGITTAIDLSDAEIVTALALGANDITATNFSLTGATGAVTSGTINGQTITSSASFSGSLTVANNFTVSAGSVSLPAGTIDNAELANSSLTVTAGNGLANGGSVSLGGTTTLNVGAGTNIVSNANDVAVVDNPTFAGLVTAQAGLTVSGGDLDVSAGDLTVSGTINGLAISGGTITAGTWQGDVVGVQYGGTGLASYTAGDLIYASGATTLSKLGVGSNGTCLVLSGGLPSWGSCAGSTATLQATYNNGNTITTTDARDIAITLANTATDSNFSVTVATGSTSQVAFVRADGAGTADPSALQLLDNQDIDRALPIALKIQSAAGGITTAVDLSDSDIVTALSLGANDITGTNFSVSGSSGNITAGTYNSQTISATANFTGSVTVASGFTVSAGSVTLPAGTIDNNELANSSVTVTAGGGLANGGSVALGASVTLDVGAGTNITVNANDIAVVANPTFAGLVTANAALSVTGGIDNNSGGITETGAIAGATTIDADNQVTLSRTGANALRVTGAPAASATSSLVQLGSAIAGGSASGTILGVNAANGYSGNLIDMQVNGTKRFVLDANGVITSSTWQGSTVGVQYGGTGLSSYTTGDLLYASDATTLSKLGVGADGTCLLLASGLPSWGSCAGSTATLQATYNNGNTITTTDARDIAFTLANTATDSNFNVTVATGSTSQVAYMRADGAGTADPSALVRIDNLDTDRALPIGLQVQSAAGGITTAIDLSDAEIVTAIALGANDITGTNFSVTGATGNVVSGTINGQTITSSASFSGSLTVANNFTVSAGSVSLPAGTIDNTELANSSVTVTAGTGLANGGAVALGAAVTLNVGAGTNIVANANDVAVVDNPTFAGLITAQAGIDVTGGDVDIAAGDLTVSGTINGLSVSGGTITAGTWQGDVVGVQYGGTGLASYTAGDLIYASGTTTLSKLGVGSNGTCLVLSGGLPTWGSCAGTTATLQATYNNGNTITTTDARDLAITLANTATDSNFSVTVATGSTSQVAFVRADGAGTADPTALQLLDNQDTDRALPIALKIQSAAGGITTAVDLSDSDIVTALSLGANDITGTSFSVNGSNGNVTAGTYNSQTISATANFTGSVTVASGFTVSAGSVSLPAGTIDNNELANSSVTVTAGGGLANGGSVALGASIALDVGAGTNITVNANDIAVVANPTFAGLVTANAALSVTGGIDNNSGGITETGAVAGATTIDADNQVTLSRTGANALRVTGAPAASATSSLVQLGSAIAGGSASGTILGVNAANGYGGNLIDMQVNGTKRFVLDANGVITSSTWQGSTVGVQYGGTGLSSYSTGDLLYASGATTLSKLAAGSDGTCLVLATGLPSWGSCAGSTATLQATYNNGNTITTTDNRDIAFTLANTATDSNFNVTVATGSTSQVAYLRADGAGTADPSALVRIDNLDTDRVLPVGLVVQSAAGGMTTAIDLSDAEIVTALALGANDITGTNFSLTGATGAITSGTINGQTITSSASFSGSLTVANNFTVSAGSVSLPAGTIDNAELANSSLTVTAGNGLANGGSVSLGGTTTLNVGAGTNIVANANDVAVIDNPTFAGLITAQAGVDVTGGDVDIAAGDLTVSGSINGLSVSGGTITAGTWQGDVVGVQYGGTGLASYTAGDLIYASGATTLSKLGVGSNGTCLVLSGGLPTWASCAGTTATLQATYNNGNTITTTDNRDLAITLANTATDSNFSVTVATDSTSQVAFVRADGAGTADPSALQLLDNQDTDRALPIALKIQSAAGGITTAVDLSDSDIVTALSLGANDITGTNFSVNGSNGNVTAGTYNSQTISATANFTGSVTVASGFTVSAGSVSLPAGTIDNSELANSSVTVTAGTGLANGGSVALGATVTLNVGAGTNIVANANDVAVVDNPTFAGLVTAQAGLDVTGGNVDIAAGDLTVSGTINGLSVSGGIVTAGTWQGDVVGVQYGGTGLASYTAGDLIYASGATTLSKLGVGSNGTCLVLSGGLPTWASCAGTTATLQATYNNGNTITTTDNRDLAITLANTATDSNFNVTVATGSTSQVAFVRADGAGTADPSALQLLDNQDTDRALPIALKIQSAAGGITTAVDLSDSDIVTALALGANDITGTSFSVNGSNGNVTAGTYNSQTISATANFTGSVTVASGFTVSAGSVTLPAGTIDNSELANSSVTVTAGNGLTTGGSVALGASVTLDIGAGTNITVNANDIAVVANPTFAGLVTASAGIDITGGIDNNAGGITDTGAVAGVTTLDADNQVTLSRTGANALRVTGAPAASATSSLVQLGSAIAGGSASGTILGVNAANGYGGNLVDLQVNGTKRFVLDANGVITSSTWQGSTVGVQYGGTGLSSYSNGDLLYASGATTLSKLAAGSDGTCLVLASGLPSWSSCAGTTATLQATYNNGNTITTTDNRDIAFTLANTATDSNFDVTVATGSTSQVAYMRADGAGTADPSALVRIDNLDTDRALPIGLQVQSAAGGMTTAIDLSDAEIVTALALGANDITGTNFSLTGATGAITSGTINGQTITSSASFSGSLTVANNFTVSAGSVSLPAGTIDNSELANSSVTVTAGNGLVNGGTVALGATITVNVGAGTNIVANANDVAVVDNPTFAGLVTAQAGLDVTGGDVDIAAGDLTVSGTINGLSVSGGTITAGTWQGDVVGVQYGGTGLASYTAGDLLYASGATTLAKLGVGSDGTCLVLSGGLPSWGSCAGTTATLQATYNNGNTITTTDARDLAITLANTATDSNFNVTVATGSTSQIAFIRADGAGSADPSALQLLDNQDTDRALPIALKIQSAAGGITTAVDLSDADIVTALALGANDITGTSFSVNGSNGNVTAGTYNSQTISATANFTGSVTVASGFTVTAGTVSLPAGEIDNAELANSSLTVTAGAGLTNGGVVSLGGSTTLDIGAGTNITVNANDIAVVNNPTFSGLVTASAGIDITGGIDNNAGGITDTGAVAGVTTLGASGQVTLSNTGSNTLRVTGAPAGSATDSLVQLGSAISGGSASGTFLGLNAANGYAGNLIDLQVNSISYLKVNASGVLTLGSSAGPNGSGVINITPTTPNGNSTSSLLKIGAALSSGSNAGTVISFNTGTAVLFTGNLLDLQVADTSKFKISGTGAATFSSSITGVTTYSGSSTLTLTGTGANELAVTGAPAASATSSLVQLGSAISGGSASGTFLGTNAANGYAGNLVDLQVNSVSEFKVTSGGALTIAGAFTGATSATLGAASGTTGTLLLTGSTSGVVTIQPQNAAGTYNFNLPTTAGTTGYVLTSAGGGSSAMTWTNPASLGVKWSSLIDPTGNLALAMGTNTTAMNWATGTSSNDLLSLTTDNSANGTGALLNVQTGTSASVVPLRVRAGSTEAIYVSSTGNVAIGSTTAGSTLTLHRGSGGTALAVRDTGDTTDNVTITDGGAITAAGLLTLSASATNALNLSGNPPTSATSSLIQMGSAIVGGTASGTWIGINSGSSLRNFLDLQVSGTSKFKVTGAGSIVMSGGITGATNVTTSGTFTSTTTSSAAFATSGTVVADSATSIIQLAAAISGGSANGTFYGANAANGFSGNLVDLQTNSVSQFKVTGAGVVTTAGALTVSSGGATITAGGLTVTAGGISVNTTGITNTGAISGVTTYSGSSTLTLTGTGANQLAVTGAPAASATDSLIQLGSAISGGSASGTFLGLNAGSGFTGNLLDFQVNGSTQFSVGGATNTQGGRGWVNIFNPSSDSNGAGIQFKTNSAANSGIFQLDNNGNMVFRTSQGGMYFDNFGSGSQYFRVGGSNIAIQIDNTKAITINGAVTNSVTGAVAESLTGTPATSATSSLLRLGGAISGGSGNGTYLGLNAASGFTGNLAEMQINGTSRFVVGYNGDVSVKPATTAVGLTISLPASAAADAYQVKNSSGTIIFAVDVLGDLATGNSLPGVPIIGIDSTSGTAGDIVSSGQFRVASALGATVSIGAGDMYTSDSSSSPTKVSKCHYGGSSGFSIGNSVTRYLVVTADGSASTSGITCTVTASASLPTYSASFPTVVIAKVVSGVGTITSVTDTRFFAGGSLTYMVMPASSTYEPGYIVKQDTGVDNGILTTTTGSDTTVMGIVVIGQTTGGSTGTVVVMLSGSAYAQAISSVTRGGCAGTSTTAGAIDTITAGVGKCAGKVMTAASSSRLSALVQVSPM